MPANFYSKQVFIMIIGGIFDNCYSVNCRFLAGYFWHREKKIIEQFT